MSEPDMRTLQEKISDAEMRAEKLSAAFEKFISQAITVKKVNTPEWMEYFADCINEAIKAVGSDSSVVLHGRCASQYQLKSGS